jgi:hypoxanthine-guanine phosphoribosyltransferase
VPDELFVGYGFDVEERYRNLPDLHVLRGAAAST